MNVFFQALDPTSDCHDQQVDTNTTLYICFKKPGTKDEFDDLKEVAGQDFEYEYQADTTRKATAD